MKSQVLPNPQLKYKKFPDIKTTDNILLLTHTDLDGAGATILLKSIFPNVTVEHCSNQAMSYTIKNSIIYPETSNKYDKIIACDISCNPHDAQIINKFKEKNKLIIIDHHDTALFLNKYPWAIVHPKITDTDFRIRYYKNPKDAHSSGTSLLYDFLQYKGYAKNIVNQNIAQSLVYHIAGWDTWDWVYHFDSNPKFSQLNTLCETYGLEMFEEIWIEKLNNPNSEFFNETDQLLLHIAQNKINNHLKNIKKHIKQAILQFNNELNDTTYYNIAICDSTQYLAETFDLMKKLYPTKDLYIIETKNGFSVRSTKENIHVGEMLTKIGGGGHKEAGGVSIPSTHKIELKEKTLQAHLYFE